MKISILVGTISILAGLVGSIFVHPATANLELKDTTADLLNKEFLKQNNSTELTEDGETKTDRVSQTATLKQRSPVFYLINETTDRDVLDLQNLTMGIVEAGEVVTIIDRQESMVKVQFDSTNRIGWVSQRVLGGS